MGMGNSAKLAGLQQSEAGRSENQLLIGIADDIQLTLPEADQPVYAADGEKGERRKHQDIARIPQPVGPAYHIR
jgi:hypothetical protein